MKECNAYIGIPPQKFSCSDCFNDFKRFDFLKRLLSLQTSLLCMMGELVGGGSVTGDR